MSLSLNKDPFTVFNSELVWDCFIAAGYIYLSVHSYTYGCVGGVTIIKKIIINLRVGVWEGLGREYLTEAIRRKRNRESKIILF